MHRNDQRYREYLNLLASDINGQHSAPQREASEDFIRQRYREAFGAEIQHFMPILLSLRDAAKEHQAALGLRPAKNSELFLEHYLDRPVEQVISGYFQEPVSRDGIVEVGNLAMRDRGAARSLIIAMTAFLCAAKYQWVVFTIGPILSNSFSRLGLPLTDLGPASLTDLPESERADWGSYYEQKPRVMAGRLADAHDFLFQYSIQEHALKMIWQQAQRVARATA